MNQVEDLKAIDALTTTATLHNNRLELLLSDHSQKIDLAKTVFPDYAKDDDNWIMVSDITQ